MNTSLYLGKSYLAGDGDNTISALNTHDGASTYYSDKKYCGDPISVLILLPISMSKAHIDYELTLNRWNYLMDLRKYETSNNDISSTWVIRFCVPSAGTDVMGTALESFIKNMSFSDSWNPKLSINIGSVVKYYDIDKGSWIYETICRKEIKGYALGNSNINVSTKPFEIIIGTKSKPELVKIEKKTNDASAPIITIDLKTGSENNIILTD